jgi:hypothetical protein
MQFMLLDDILLIMIPLMIIYVSLIEESGEVL